ncbi:copper resistance protein NlpE [Pontibacter silvestris]|uniref:Copper resistance protein NlpE n=1 Tax=Pontibacter silvestris TaxID=2305183 RepID=A0ABW4X360_9BACT|nr:copper resistance protein NlpE [Pontibacter silvestris]MCC9134950.1 copper resistance protein NlpE [Pontibacter silvestris]
MINILAVALLSVVTHIPDTDLNSNIFTTSSRAIETQPLNQAKPVAVTTGTYVGVIPCADCEGIRMELILNKDKTFSLKQTYKGEAKGKNNLEVKGKWFAAKGNSQNPSAVIIQLIPAGNHDPAYFRQVSKTRIKMLDRQQNEIKSKQNYTLEKQG